jgi:hypothetical protein
LQGSPLRPVTSRTKPIFHLASSSDHALLDIPNHALMSSPNHALLAPTKPF